MTPPASLTFEAFASRIGDALDIDVDLLSPDARLVEDVGLDSFDLVEMLTTVEELGVRLPDEVAAGIETMGDLYREYSALIAHP